MKSLLKDESGHGYFGAIDPMAWVVLVILFAIFVGGVGFAVKGFLCTFF